MPLNEYYQIINNIRRHILFAYNNMRGTITAIMFQLLHKTTIYINSNVLFSHAYISRPMISLLFVLYSFVWSTVGQKPQLSDTCLGK